MMEEQALNEIVDNLTKSIRQANDLLDLSLIHI